MKDFWWIVQARLAFLRRHPIRGLMIVLIPLVSVLVYTLAYQDQTTTSAISVALVVPKESAQSRQLQVELRKTMTVQKMTAKQAKNAIGNFRLDGYITLPADYSEKLANGQQPKIIFASNLEKGSLSQLKSNLTQAAATVNRIQGLTTANQSFQQVVENLTKATTKMTFQASNQSIDQKVLTVSVIGFITMLMLFQSGQFGSGLLIEERRQGIFQRLLTTPLAKTAYFGGTSFVSVGILAVESVFTLVVIHFIMGVTFGWNVLGILGLLILFAALATMWSMAIGMLTTNSSIASAVQTICFVVTSMLSGATVPIEVMPEFMQHFAQWMPQFWLLKGIQFIQNRQNGSTIGICVAVLIAYSLFFFSLAMYGYRKQKQLKMYQ